MRERNRHFSGIVVSVGQEERRLLTESPRGAPFFILALGRFCVRMMVNVALLFTFQFRGAKRLSGSTICSSHGRPSLVRSAGLFRSFALVGLSAVRRFLCFHSLLVSKPLLHVLLLEWWCWWHAEHFECS